MSRKITRKVRTSTNIDCWTADVALHKQQTFPVFRRSQTTKTKDLEKQEKSSDARKNLKSKLACHLFGVEDCALSLVPGYASYIRYLEHQITAVHAMVIVPVLTILRFDTTGFESVVDLLCVIFDLFHESKKTGLSIDEVLEALYRHYGVAEQRPSKEAQHLIFAVIGWFTMLFRADLSNETIGKCDLKIEAPARNHNHSLRPTDLARRPIASGLLKSVYGSLLPQSDSNSPLNGTEDHRMLHVSSTNYFSLSIIGKIKVEWVDTLGSHLEFDPLQRTLYLFRLPSFCALSCVNQGHNSFDW